MDSATFEYNKDWLASPLRYSIEPALPLDPDPFHTPADKPQFGTIGDCPRPLGPLLMRRVERRRAGNTGETPRTLREIDYLLMVNDEARQGALRFAAQPGRPFLAADVAALIPTLAELPRLLSATGHVISECESDEELRFLLASPIMLMIGSHGVMACRHLPSPPLVGYYCLLFIRSGFFSCSHFCWTSNTAQA